MARWNPLPTICVAGIGFGDTTPPTLTLDYRPTSLSPGRSIRLRGSATDDDSGMHSIEIFDGPIVLHAIIFSEGQTQWDARVNLDAASRYHLTIVATDTAGNQTQIHHTIHTHQQNGPASTTELPARL